MKEFKKSISKSILKFVPGFLSVQLFSLSVYAISVPSALHGQLQRSAVKNSAPHSTCPLLRLKLWADSVNSDETVFGFSATASASYNGMEDARYFAGFGDESLSSLSSDNIRLAINVLPLPKAAPLLIKLVVDGGSSGIYKLQKISLDAGIPSVYEFWLIDKYKKDSLDIRNNSSYSFSIDINDPASFGSNRFELMIRENRALFVHLLNFNAIKAANSATISWKTENEENYTSFSVERSTDNSSTFSDISSFTSDGRADYAYADKTPGNVSDSYRLKIEDMNGTVSYSKTITLVYQQISTPLVSSHSVSLYPNPASGMINMNIDQHIASATTGQEQYDISIMNVMGKVVKKVLSSPAVSQQNISDLQPGTYFVQVVNNNNKSLLGQSKFVKF